MSMRCPIGNLHPALTVLAAALLVAGAPGCGDAADPCMGEEVVHLKMTGGCSTGTREFDLTRIACRLMVTPGDVGLPVAGAIDQQGHVIRRGGWQLFGCATGVEPCPGQFRRCATVRVDWQLDMECLDDRGDLACRATLTE